MSVCPRCSDLLSDDQDRCECGAWAAESKHLKTDGYVLVSLPNGKRISEHRLVAQKQLGRELLPGEVVHHLNGIRDDNRPENLLVFPDDAAHKRYHADANKVAPCPTDCEFDWQDFHERLDTALAHFLEETDLLPGGVSLMDFITYSNAKRKAAA